MEAETPPDITNDWDAASRIMPCDDLFRSKKVLLVFIIVHGNIAI